MARGKSSRLVLGFIGPPPDDRPTSTVQFADPSTASAVANVHTFNEPPSPGSCGSDEGARPLFGRQAPWSQAADGMEAYEAMNRRRGVSSEATDDADG